jgi:hypothetical protein
LLSGGDAFYGGWRLWLGVFVERILRYGF